MLQIFRWNRPMARMVVFCGGFSLVLALFVYFRFLSFVPPHVLRVGFSNFAPYLIDNGSSEPRGLAADMIRRAAQSSHIFLKWVRVADIDEALRTGKIDLYPLATLTAQRMRDFHTSEAWWDNEIALVSLKGQELKGVGDARGKRIGIRGLPIVKQMAEHLFPEARLIAVPRAEELVLKLCSGSLDGIFLDLRLLESFLLKGTHCGGHELHVVSIPNGSLWMGTLASKSESGQADRIYEYILRFSGDGTLSEIASSWSIYNPYQSRHILETLEAKSRADLLRYGLAGVVVVLILSTLQTQRIRRARASAETARSEAEESTKRFDTFMRHMPAVAFIKNAEGKLAFVNDSFCRLFEKTADHFLGKTDWELWPTEQANRFRQNDCQILQQNRGEEVLETAVAAATGERRTFLSYKFPFSHSSGEMFLGGVAIDITERLRAEEALRLSQFSIDCSEDTMLWISDRGIILNANQSACRDLGYSKEELLGLHVADIDTLTNQQEFQRSRDELKLKGNLTLESIHKRKDGSTHPVEIRQNFLEFQGAEYSCCMCRDITERKSAEREMNHQATHDALTGLPNRRPLEKQLARALEEARRTDNCVGVVYLDLDGFKLVNDTLGHGTGDKLLQQVAARLRSTLREQDMLFRMGGDEFTALLPDLQDQSEIGIFALRMLATLQESFAIEGQELSVTASLGVSVFPRDGAGESDLLRKADAAMYESKRQGKNRIQFFNPELGEQARERLDLENQLRRALQRDEFSLMFQPEFCLASDKILRHEVLLRWTHPTLGSIPPSKFIPIAEDTALIVPIGRWVLEEACRRAAAWQRTGSEGVGIGVNVSLVQFHRADFIDTITETLHSSGLPPRLLELELTESVVMHGAQEVANKIARLRALGVSVSVDDFGTGYSSLSYLRQLPIDSLKIDRSFMSDVTTDPGAFSLAAALVSIARGLGLKVVAEGIETPGQLAAIRRLGFDIGQGYYLGMPSTTPLTVGESVAA